MDIGDDERRHAEDSALNRPVCVGPKFLLDSRRPQRVLGIRQLSASRNRVSR
jgi:hypothetical protein